MPRKLAVVGVVVVVALALAAFWFLTIPDTISASALAPHPPDLANGKTMFNAGGCASCHGTNGEGGRGPALAGVFGKETELQGGGKVTVDEAYVRESIINPQAKLVANFGPIMPTFQGQISEDQLVQLVAFIKSLPAGGQVQTPAPTPLPCG